MKCPHCGGKSWAGHACSYQDAATGRRVDLRHPMDVRNLTDQIAILRAIVEEAIDVVRQRCASGVYAPCSKTDRCVACLDVARLRARLEEVDRG